MTTDGDDADDLLRRAAAGDAAALDRFFALHRDRLRTMVRSRRARAAGERPGQRSLTLMLRP